ncbi:MAG TPA: flagellar basal body P-ring formation chaperone FlgA [Acidobacteriota bacterium]|nr:flagellar basal body P-ring formation chaperone FlgA [Acidobacteriota bacterium]
MKQAPNSLLTCFATTFVRIPDAGVRRERTSVFGCRPTPFFVYQEKMRMLRCFLLGFSCRPRSIVRFKLGEERIRGLLYGILLTLVFLLCDLAPVVHASSGEQLHIKLKEEAAVVSSNVLLKDIAVLSGPDERQLEKIGNIKILDAPAFGETEMPSRNQISARLQAAAGPLPDGTISGASAVRIRLQGRQITADEIRPMLRARIVESTSWKESEIRIPSIGSLNGIELPPADAGFRMAAAGAVFGKKNILVPLEILQGGKNLRSYWISADVVIHADVLAAGRKISQGETFAPGDIEKKYVEIPDIRADYARDPDEVVGKVSRRGLLPGVLLTREAISDPLFVKSGETVRLRLERNGIRLTSLAKAEQDGQLGQFIRVRSIDFSTYLKAQVIGHSEVRVQ